MGFPVTDGAAVMSRIRAPAFLRSDGSLDLTLALMPRRVTRRKLLDLPRNGGQTIVKGLSSGSTYCGQLSPSAVAAHAPRR